MSRVRVLIADDHALVRAGIRQIVEKSDGMTIVAEAESGNEAVAKVLSTEPDVVLLDITMPGTVATECIEEIIALSPATRVLVVTMHDDPLYLRAVLAAGATGYVTKNAAPTTLIDAIHSVRLGKRYVAAAVASSEVAKSSAGQTKHGGVGGAGIDGRVKKLSQREGQVLTLIARGYSYQEIAERLHISRNSVGTYRSRVAVKFGFKSRADLVRTALELGLIGDSE